MWKLKKHVPRIWWKTLLRVSTVGREDWIMLGQHWIPLPHASNSIEKKITRFLTTPICSFYFPKWNIMHWYMYLLFVVRKYRLLLHTKRFFTSIQAIHYVTSVVTMCLKRGTKQQWKGSGQLFLLRIVVSHVVHVHSPLQPFCLCQQYSLASNHFEICCVVNNNEAVNGVFIELDPWPDWSICRDWHWKWLESQVA